MRELRLSVVVLAAILAIAAKIFRATGDAPDSFRAPLGWLPSFGYGLGVPLLLASLSSVARRPRRARWTIYLAAIAGMLVAELTQRWEPGRTFAAADLLALLAGSALALSLEAWIERREATPGTAVRT